MYLADYHTHSATSPDGQLTVSELAEAAVRAGLDEICVTDHVDTILWGSHKPREDFDWPALQAQVDEGRRPDRAAEAERHACERAQAHLPDDLLLVFADVLLNGDL